jgi:hypothetical protein
MNYRVEWMPLAAALGLVTLWFVPYLGLLIGLAILLVVAAGLVVLAGAVIAVPFLILRSVHRRRRAPAAALRSKRRVYGGETALPPARVG